MPYDPFKYHRKSIRLPEYDYSQPGAYFITIATFHRQTIFGEIIESKMRLNEYGDIACAEWLKTSKIRREITLVEFVIMPNHMYGIVVIMENAIESVRATGCESTAINMAESVGATGRESTAINMAESVGATGRESTAINMAESIGATRRVAPTLVAHSIGAIMAQYKSIVAKRINHIRGTPGAPVWQRNYYACPPRMRGKHIIRDLDDLSRIREYINNNPLRCEMDY